MSHEQESVDVESETSPKKLSAVGGFVGTVLGSRRGPGGAVAGGFLGGTLGYLTGATLRVSAGDGSADVEPEPVSIDVADSEDESAGEENETDE
jgi:hypothetical protein